VNAPFPAPLSLNALVGEKAPAVSWLASPLVPAGGNVLIVGYPKCCKTFFALDLAISLASSTPFLGRYEVPDDGIPVGLVCMEGQRWQIGRRIRRLCKSHGISPRSLEEKLKIWYRPPLLFSDEKALTGLAEYAEFWALQMLIVDAWAYVSTGKSDNADDVTPQLTAFSNLRERVPQLTTGLVHHARKESHKKGADRVTDLTRGSSAFGAWYDCGIALSRKDENSPVKVRAELRDYDSPSPFSFTVEDEVPGSADNDWQADGKLILTATDKTPDKLRQEEKAKAVMPVVRSFIEANPHCTKRQVREGVPGDNKPKDLAVQMLIEWGEIEEKGSDKRFHSAQLVVKNPDGAGGAASVLPAPSKGFGASVLPPRRGEAPAPSPTMNSLR